MNVLLLTCFVTLASAACVDIFGGGASASAADLDLSTLEMMDVSFCVPGASGNNAGEVIVKKITVTELGAKALSGNPSIDLPATYIDTMGTSTEITCLIPILGLLPALQDPTKLKLKDIEMTCADPNGGQVYAALKDEILVGPDGTKVTVQVDAMTQAVTTVPYTGTDPCVGPSLDKAQADADCKAQQGNTPESTKKTIVGLPEMTTTMPTSANSQALSLTVAALALCIAALQ